MDSTELLIAASVVVVLIITVIVLILQTKAHKERLAHQAEKRGGEFREGGLFKNPEVRIPLKGVVIVIHTIPGSKHSSPKTIAKAELDSPRLPVVRILRNSLWQKALAAFGRERLLSGDEEFDNKWVVQADDPFIIHKLATAEFKSRLEERILRTLDIRLQPQEATFTILAIPSDDDGYDHFIDTVMLVLNKFL